MLRLCFINELFWYSTVKGTVPRKSVLFAKFCGARMYDTAVYSNILLIREIDFTPRAPLLKNNNFQAGDFKILKAGGEFYFRPKLPSQVMISYTFS
jgi:hypothetical protein